MSVVAGFESLDPDVTVADASPDPQAELRFARAAVAHLTEQQTIAADRLAAMKAREKEVIATHKAKTAEALKMARDLAEELAAAEAHLADLEG